MGDQSDSTAGSSKATRELYARMLETPMGRNHPGFEKWAEADEPYISSHYKTVKIFNHKTTNTPIYGSGSAATVSNDSIPTSDIGGYAYNSGIKNKKVDLPVGIPQTYYDAGVPAIAMRQDAFAYIHDASSNEDLAALQINITEWTVVQLKPGARYWPASSSNAWYIKSNRIGAKVSDSLDSLAGYPKIADPEAGTYIWSGDPRNPYRTQLDFVKIGYKTGDVIQAYKISDAAKAINTTGWRVIPLARKDRYSIKNGYRFLDSAGDLIWVGDGVTYYATEAAAQAACAKEPPEMYYQVRKADLDGVDAWFLAAATYSSAEEAANRATAADEAAGPSKGGEWRVVILTVGQRYRLTSNGHKVLDATDGAYIWGGNDNSDITYFATEADAKAAITATHNTNYQLIKTTIGDDIPAWYMRPIIYNSFEEAQKHINKTNHSEAAKEVPIPHKKGAKMTPQEIKEDEDGRWEIVDLSIGQKYDIIDGTKVFNEPGKHFLDDLVVEGEIGIYVWVNDTTQRYFINKHDAMTLLSADPQTNVGIHQTRVHMQTVFYNGTFAIGDKYNLEDGYMVFEDNGKYIWHGLPSYKSFEEAAAHVRLYSQAVQEIPNKDPDKHTSHWQVVPLTLGEKYNLRDGVKITQGPQSKVTPPKEKTVLHDGGHFEDKDGAGGEITVVSEEGIYIWIDDSGSGRFYHDYIAKKDDAISKLSGDPETADALVSVNINDYKAWYITALKPGDKYSFIKKNIPGMNKPWETPYKQKMVGGDHTWNGPTQYDTFEDAAAQSFISGQVIVPVGSGKWEIHALFVGEYYALYHGTKIWATAGQSVTVNTNEVPNKVTVEGIYIWVGNDLHEYIGEKAAAVAKLKKDNNPNEGLVETTIDGYTVWYITEMLPGDKYNLIEKSVKQITKDGTQTWSGK